MDIQQELAASLEMQLKLEGQAKDAERLRMMAEERANNINEEHIYVVGKVKGKLEKKEQQIEVLASRYKALELLNDAN